MLSLSHFPLSPPHTPTLSPPAPLLLPLRRRPTPRLLCSTAQNLAVNGVVGGGRFGEDPLLDVAVNDVVGARVGEDPVLPVGLRREELPGHVAVIMDGNRRWARTRGLPTVAGYEAGLRALRGLVELCCRFGIRVLTVFAFSSDNWLRPKVEVGFLMRLLERGMKNELNNFMRDNIRFSCIGDSSKLPDPVKELITYAEERTKDNSGLQLIIAVSYTGKYDIMQACKTIAQKVKDGAVEPEDIDEFLIEQELQTNHAEIPNPDLLIRTSGELRVSNFLLWQLAYTELYFTQSHWPEFGETEFVMALRSFQRRQRRYEIDVTVGAFGIELRSISFSGPINRCPNDVSHLKGSIKQFLIPYKRRMFSGNAIILRLKYLGLESNYYLASGLMAGFWQLGIHPDDRLALK